MGRIETLFVKANAAIWGSFNEDTLQTSIHDEKQEGDKQLIEKAVLLTLHNGGDVYVMDETNLLPN